MLSTLFIVTSKNTFQPNSRKLDCKSRYKNCNGCDVVGVQNIRRASEEDIRVHTVKMLKVQMKETTHERLPGIPNEIKT